MSYQDKLITKMFVKEMYINLENNELDVQLKKDFCQRNVYKLRKMMSIAKKKILTKKCIYDQKREELTG